MNVVTRYLRRRWLARCIAHHQREVQHLEQLRANIGPALDRALRELGHARTDLVFLDIYRPPISHAPGAHRRDGVVRPITKRFDEHA